MFEHTIVFEDADLLALHKPAGVVVNDAQSVQQQTIQSWARTYIKTSDGVGWSALVPADFDPSYGTPESIFERRSGMVHRLDKNTSGVLLFAKNPGALVNMLQQFRERSVKKTYQCLVHGQLSQESGVVSVPIGRRQRDRKLYGVTPNGRPASTEFSVLETYSKITQECLKKHAIQKKSIRIYEQGFSLVSCKPKTGRTHQIRVHMAHLHHPIVGDTSYAGRKRAKLDAVWCPRQFLHATRLICTHPRTGEQLKLQAELAQDLQSVLNCCISN